MLKRFPTCFAAFVALSSGATLLQAQTADLTQVGIEDLMKMQVTSVSKKDEPLFHAPSSVYVITQEDIHHSGATNVPDLLRMVPGVEVARINANAWAISIRGFDFRYAGMVLVLIDGRSVYSPSFSGVYWDDQNVPLDNIERIEVIRGPGGTVWGANAMNGVINIITKSAANTKGGLIGAEIGSQDRSQTLVRYGGSAGANGNYRIYGRYAMNTNSPSLPGAPAVDQAHSAQAGFRADWNLSPADKLTVQGDFVGNSEAQTITTLLRDRLPDTFIFNDNVRDGAGNLLGHWSHVFADGSETTLQMYYDRLRRFDQGLYIANTGDAQFRYHFHVGWRNDIVAGTEFRFSDQQFTDGYEVSLGDGHRRDHLASAFLQDEFLVSNAFAITLGSKVEHNSYTGVEFEPSIQFAWSRTPNQTWWASVSRTIEQPSWLYADSQIDAATVPVPGNGFALIRINGNPRGLSPVLFNYEIGHRRKISDSLTVDANVFAGHYLRLQTPSGTQQSYVSADPAPPHLVIPLQYANPGSAINYGVEFSAQWKVARRWLIKPGFSYLQMRFAPNAPGLDPGFNITPGDSSRFKTQLRSEVKLTRKLEWDAAAFYVSGFRDGASSEVEVPAYTRVDSRLAWRAGEFTEFSITGQNLLSPRHQEFSDGPVSPMANPRAVTATIRWRF